MTITLEERGFVYCDNEAFLRKLCINYNNDFESGRSLSLKNNTFEGLLLNSIL